jgi:nitrogen-specific signal transduction histidine kinase
MARRIVQNHGGDIDFTTQPGHTVFRVRLPATTKA